MRREPFSVITTAALWTDPHVSEQMLRCHLDPTTRAASRPPDEIEAAVAWTSATFALRAGSSVLDLGCGPGLYTIRWASTGADVTGVDFSWRSIAYAREAAARAGLPVRAGTRDPRRPPPAGRYPRTMTNATILGWLLDSDPSIRWQTLRDLADAPPPEYLAERARVATEGWGARLLALRGDDGLWASGALFPARDGKPLPWSRAEGQPWTATAYSLVALQDFGVDPQDERVSAAVAHVRDTCHWEHAGQPFFEGEVEPCINGMVVSLGAYFGQHVDGVVDRLVGEQLEDGGWNCEVENGSVRASFHTTIRVLEGLLSHEHATGGSPASIAARRRGEEYLLERSLLRRKSTGEIVDPEWLQFSFPTRWHYDALRGLEYFRSTGDRPDPRLGEAIALVRSKRQPDGTWLLENTHKGAVPFRMEDGDGRPSRWNTLRALRVLRWHDGSIG